MKKSTVHGGGGSRSSACTLTGCHMHGDMTLLRARLGTRPYNAGLSRRAGHGVRLLQEQRDAQVWQGREARARARALPNSQHDIEEVDQPPLRGDRLDAMGWWRAWTSRGRRPA